MVVCYCVLRCRKSMLTADWRRISRFDGVGTTSGDVGTLLYRLTEDAKQAPARDGMQIAGKPQPGVEPALPSSRLQGFQWVR